MTVYMVSVACVFGHVLNEKGRAGCPLRCLFDWETKVVLCSCHTLVYQLADYCGMFDHIWPRHNVVDPCSYWLFAKEVASIVNVVELIYRKNSTKGNVGLVFIVMLFPSVVMHLVVEVGKASYCSAVWL